MSKLLVFLQFCFILLVGYPFAIPTVTYLNVTLGAGLFVCGITVFFIALLTMRRRTFTIFPEPKAGGVLINSGIYAYVRHPMYLAVILCGCGAGLFYGVWWKWLLNALLVLLLWLKIRREEQMLLARFSEYALYKQRTKAIIPFLL